MEKEAKSAEEGENVDHGRRVIAPARREEITGQSRVSDNEALKPHADIDKDRYDPNQVGCCFRECFLNQKSCGQITLQETMIQ